MGTVSAAEYESVTNSFIRRFREMKKVWFEIFSFILYVYLLQIKYQNSWKKKTNKGKIGQKGV